MTTRAPGWYVATVDDGIVAGPFPLKRDAKREIGYLSDTSDADLIPTWTCRGLYEYLGRYCVGTHATLKRHGFEVEPVPTPNIVR